MKRGKLVILSGPSGVGKDTVIDAWKVRDPGVERVIARTTRPKRENEIDGVDYAFITEGEFLRLASDGFFLEYKNVFGNYYGTPLVDMEQILKEGRTAVLKIDVQGALTVMSLRPDAITVFILPPSNEELERRIVGRNTDAPDVIAKRLSTAHDEMALANHYQHQIINESVDAVVGQLMELTR